HGSSGEQVKFHNGGAARILEEGDAGLLKRRVRIGQQIRHGTRVEIANSAANDRFGLEPVIVAIADEAAAVAVVPKTEVRAPGSSFQIACAVRKSKPVRRGKPRFVTGAAWPSSPHGSPCAAIGTPKTIAIGSTGTERKPAVEHHEVVPACAPIQWLPQSDIVQVDQVQAGTVARSQAN